MHVLIDISTIKAVSELYLPFSFIVTICGAAKPYGMAANNDQVIIRTHQGQSRRRGDG